MTETIWIVTLKLWLRSTGTAWRKTSKGRMWPLWAHHAKLLGDGGRNWTCLAVAPQQARHEGERSHQRAARPQHKHVRWKHVDGVGRLFQGIQLHVAEEGQPANPGRTHRSACTWQQMQVWISMCSCLATEGSGMIFANSFCGFIPTRAIYMNLDTPFLYNPLSKNDSDDSSETEFFFIRCWHDISQFILWSYLCMGHKYELWFAIPVHYNPLADIKKNWFFYGWCRWQNVFIKTC